VRDAELVYPRGWHQPARYQDMDPAAREVALENLLAGGAPADNALGADFDAAVYHGEDGTCRIAVFARVPNRDLGHVEVAFGARRRDGSLTDLTRASLVDFPRDLDLALYDVLISEEFPDTIRCYLRNLETGSLSIIDRPVSPSDLPSREQPIGRILLAGGGPAQIFLLPQLHGDSVRNALRKREDPLVFDDKRFLPRPDSVFEEPEQISFTFQLAAEDGDFELSIALGTGQGTPIAPGSTLERYARGNRTGVLGSLDARGLAPGVYALVVTARDRREGTRHRRSAPFTVRARD